MGRGFEERVQKGQISAYEELILAIGDGAEDGDDVSANLDELLAQRSLETDKNRRVGSADKRNRENQFMHDVLTDAEKELSEIISKINYMIPNFNEFKSLEVHAQRDRVWGNKLAAAVADAEVLISSINNLINTPDFNIEEQRDMMTVLYKRYVKQLYIPAKDMKEIRNYKGFTDDSQSKYTEENPTLAVAMSLLNMNRYSQVASFQGIREQLNIIKAEIAGLRASTLMTLTSLGFTGKENIKYLDEIYHEKERVFKLEDKEYFEEAPKYILKIYTFIINIFATYVNMMREQGESNQVIERLLLRMIELEELTKSVDITDVDWNDIFDTVTIMKERVNKNKFKSTITESGYKISRFFDDFLWNYFSVLLVHGYGVNQKAAKEIAIEYLQEYELVNNETHHHYALPSTERFAGSVSSKVSKIKEYLQYSSTKKKLYEAIAESKKR